MSVAIAVYADMVTLANKHLYLDAATSSQSPECCRRNTLEAPPFLPKQNQTSSQHRQVDARRAAAIDRLK